MSCLICGHDKVFATYTIGDYQLACCSRCGHAVTNPMPAAGDLAKLYNKEYFAAHYEEISPADSGFAKRIRQEKHRIRFVRRYKKRGALLDVGCGCGYFLYACRGIFQTTGYDVTTANREFVTRKLGIEFVVDFNEFNARQFDVITLWHSLEHFVDPGKQLRALSNLLVDEGVLLVEVPNHESIDAFVDGKEWSDWDLPFHCHHFTHSSLELMLCQHGFEVIGSNSYHSGYIKRNLAGYLVTRPVARMIAGLFAGSSIILACRKKRSR